MHLGLRLFDELATGDAEWVMDAGTEQQVISSTVLIEEGSTPDALYFVLEGLVAVTVASMAPQRLTVLGPGELFGEMSFLDGEPASASVTAVENSLLLVLPRGELDSKMRSDSEFTARFYRAMALLAQQRLRNSVDTMGRMWSERKVAVDHAGETWARLQGHLEGFQQLMQEADHAALKNDNVVPDEMADRITTGFHEGALLMNEVIGDAADENPLVKDEIGARLQRQLLPYLLLSQITERMYAKPRGYAGDFLTIELMYRGTSESTTRIGALLDRAVMNEPAARAVQNRRGLLAEEIAAVLNDASGSVQVTSLASGPAAELFDVFEGLDDPSCLKTTLVDIDLQALAHVGERRDHLKLTRQMDLRNGNLVYLAMGRQKMDVRPQDLVYSIGLIDYFSDKFVLQLLNYVHGLLKPGGKVILGNFHPRNTSKALMDHVLEWRLIHRTEDDMNRLFASSAFGRGCTEIRYEDQRVNLFAMGVKE